MKKIYHFLSSVSDTVQKPIEFVSGICLFVGALSLFLQVVNRYILAKYFNFSFTFTEELARYTIIWFTYTIAGICLKEGQLISLNLLYDRLPRIPKLILYYITRAMMLVFCFIIIRFVISFIPTAMKFKSIAMKIPGIFLYSFPGIGFALMAYEIITEVFGVMCGELPPFCGNRTAAADGSGDL